MPNSSISDPLCDSHPTLAPPSPSPLPNTPGNRPDLIHPPDPSTVHDYLDSLSQLVYDAIEEHRTQTAVMKEVYKQILKNTKGFFDRLHSNDNTRQEVPRLQDFLRTLQFLIDQVDEMEQQLSDYKLYQQADQYGVVAKQLVVNHDESPRPELLSEGYECDADDSTNCEEPAAALPSALDDDEALNEQFEGMDIDDCSGH